MPARRLARTLSRLPRPVRFACVGGLGFAVDTAVLYLALYALGLGFYGARALSFLLAATVTWAGNRSFTFPESRSPQRAAEWVRFLAVNAPGGLLNYGTYSLLVLLSETAREVPVLAVAAGSLVGLTFNFLGSARWVFTAGGPARTP